MNKDHNIQNEDPDMEGMAPQLSKLSTKNPFCHTERSRSMSDNYFDDFTSRLQNRIIDIEDIKSFAPALLNIPKHNPFDVPSDYFDELPSIVQEKILETKSRPLRFEWLTLLIKPRFVFPMVVTIFIAVLGINFMNKNAEVKNTIEIEELSLEDHLYYIDETEIIDQLTADAVIENEDLQTDNNSIENYLLDNNIDETNLNNEF
jgi:hypothetical protein